MRNKWAEQLIELVTYDHEAWSINEKKNYTGCLKGSHTKASATDK